MFEKLNKFEKFVFNLFSLFLVFFYIYSAIIQPFPVQYHRGVYVLAAYVLILFLYKSKNPILRIVDYFLIIVSFYVVGYWILNFTAITYRAGAETLQDQIVALIGVIIGIEIARRVVGIVFVIIGIVMILYGVYGKYLPDIIAHPGDTLLGLATTIFFKSDGIFGVMADVIASYVLLFVIFGAFLERSGSQKFFIDLPIALVGHKIGGPGKVAVIASALFGSISGSAIANTVSTGMFTIPLMKKAGFKPHIAGAIEPAASIGGMFMPPIMGAGGFIMSELTGVPYNKIMLISLFPALMYFLSVFVLVHYYAKDNKIVGEKSDVDVKTLLKSEWYYSLPIIVITGALLYGFSASYSAVLGILTTIIISWFKKKTRIDHNKFLEAVRVGVENSLTIGATVGIIGIIIAVLTYSGIIVSFADIVIQLAGGNIFLTILYIGIASLILGMGVPVTAAYLITAVVAVPALTKLGIDPIAAHMIVYWLSQDSNITPPVCIAAFTGATIAGANMWKTAFASFIFAKYLYVAPFLFAYVPAFTLNDTPENIIIAFILITIGTYLFSYVLSFTWWKYIKRIYQRT
ncbi:MAG: TRAP transporter fused permease subunit [Leptospiraceae bacterium]|nr:TRAP transporter fused permease subunit [Leptospiraceae bacterium]MDW7975263.1 TRAP transporter fused permease subunit [Leptospiraceae bacterium]